MLLACCQGSKYPGVLVQAINVEAATGLLATRYAPERYQERRWAVANWVADEPTPATGDHLCSRHKMVVDRL